jgi:hypothetical protein
MSDQHTGILIDWSVNYDPGMPTNVHEPEWLTPQELAAELRYDIASIYRAVRRGDLPAVRLSGCGPLRIHRSILDPDQHKETLA